MTDGLRLLKSMMLIRAFETALARRRDHGFQPTTTIDEGIPRFVDWFKTYHRID